MILQTKNPEDPVIQHVVNNDYDAMFNDVMEEREAFRYPPFSQIVNVYVKHRDDAVAESAALLLGGYLRQWFGDRILGPDKPAVARVKSLCIRKLVVKLEKGINLTVSKQYLHKAQELLIADTRYRLVQMYYDVDPL